MYDFTTPVNRTGTGCAKFAMAPEPVKGSGIVPLTIADQEFAVAPEIREAIKEAADRGIYGYTYADKEYRDAVNHWMLKRHNWDVSSLPMFSTPGVVSALGLTVRAFTKPGDGIVIQPPVYPPFRKAVALNGRELIENPLILKGGHYEIDFDDLDAKTKPENVKLFILCSPHNPVGRVWTKDELIRMGEICLKNNVFIVSDEIHFDLIRKGFEHTVFATLPEFAHNCVVCTAASKTFNLAGLSCSNIFVPDEEKAKLFAETVDRESMHGIPYFARAATISAYTKAENWLDELNKALDDNFEYLYSYIDENLPMLHAARTEGTYLAWIDMRSLKLSDKELEELMLKNYLALDEGYIFGTNGGGFERWNLALPKKLLADALSRLKKAVLSVK